MIDLAGGGEPLPHGVNAGIQVQGYIEELGDLEKRQRIFLQHGREMFFKGDPRAWLYSKGLLNIGEVLTRMDELSEGAKAKRIVLRDVLNALTD